MLRRLAFLFALSATTAAAQGQSKQDVLWEKMATQVAAIAGRLDGVMGVSILDLTDGRSFMLHADQVFPTASTIKLPLMLELYRQDQQGSKGTAGGARLLDTYTFEPADLVEDSQVMAGLTKGATVLTNHDLAQFMMAVSDNAATNVLIKRVGRDRVNAMLRAQGLTQTMLRRKMIDLAAARRGDENVATPVVDTPFNMMWSSRPLFRVDSAGTPAGNGFAFNGFCHCHFKVGAAFVQASDRASGDELEVFGSSSVNAESNFIRTVSLFAGMAEEPRRLAHRIRSRELDLRIGGIPYGAARYTEAKRNEPPDDSSGSCVFSIVVSGATLYFPNGVCSERPRSKLM